LCQGEINTHNFSKQKQKQKSKIKHLQSRTVGGAGRFERAKVLLEVAVQRPQTHRSIAAKRNQQSGTTTTTKVESSHRLLTTCDAFTPLRATAPGRALAIAPLIS
jgi:hypothetical protein